MEILNIKISRYRDLINGIKLYETDNLLIVLLNPVDYILDGISFINKHYIKRVNLEEKDEVKIKILKHKLNLSEYNDDYKSFDTIRDVVLYLQKNKSKLVEIGLESSSYSIIGNVSTLKEKYFTVKMLSTKAQYLKEENFEDRKIRMLTIDSDYLKSLEYYIEKDQVDIR